MHRRLRFQAGTSKSSKQNLRPWYNLKQQTVHRGETFRNVKPAVSGATEH